MIEQNMNVVRYNNVTINPYAIPFTFWDEDEIKVWVSNSEGDTELTKGTDFSVSGTDVVLSSAAVQTYGDYTTLTIQRVVDMVQDTDYTNGTNINAETIEQNLDKMTAMIQNLSEKQKRSIMTSISEDGDDITLPDTDSRKNKLLGFGSDGKTAALKDIAQFDQDVSNTASNATIASNAKDAAVSARDLAQEWASKFDSNNPGNTQPVADGNYSAKKYAYDANASEAEATEMRYYAEGYANGTQEEEEVGSSSRYYHNNAKYWKEQAKAISDGVPTVIDNYVNNTAKPNIDTYVTGTAEPAIDSYVENTSKPAIASYATQCSQDAEAWARGQRGGVDVPSTDPTYEKNAKYYAEQAGSIASQTITEGYVGGQKLYPASIVGVTGAMQYRAKVLQGKKCGISGGVYALVDDADETVYLFEKGLGWVANDSEVSLLLNKSDLSYASDFANANITKNLRNISSDKYFAVNKSGFHYLDLDFFSDGLLENTERITLDIPKTNFGTDNFSSGINTYGGYKTFAPFRYNGVLRTTGCSAYILYNLDGSYNSYVAATSPYTVNDKIVAIVSQDIANATVTIEPSGIIKELSDDIENLKEKELYETFYKNNDIDVTLYPNKRVTQISGDVWKLQDNSNYISIKFAINSIVYLFNHNVFNGIIYNESSNAGSALIDYYNNGFNSLSSVYTRLCKVTSGYVTISILKTDFDDFTISHFHDKAPKNNNYITEVLPFEFYGNVGVRYNANYVCSNIIASPTYLSEPNNDLGSFSSEQIKTALIASDYTYSIGTAIDVTQWVQNDAYVNQTNYMVAWKSDATREVIATAIPYKKAVSYLESRNNLYGSDSFDLTAYKMKVLPEHSSHYWRTKKFAFLGDSLTADATYVPWLTRALGLTRYSNCGQGGTTMEGSDGTSMNQDGRINALPTDLDIVIIMAGTNGSGSIGNLDLANCDISTFIGAYNVCISKIYYRYGVSTGYYTDIDYTGITQVSEARDVQIMIVTPPYNQDASRMTNFIYPRGEALKQMSRLWGIPVVESIPKMQTNLFNDSIAFSSGDGTHYKRRNQMKLANAIIAELRAIEPIAESYENNVIDPWS